jgi:hypothetical protein
MKPPIKTVLGGALACALTSAVPPTALAADDIRLLVRADDIGSTHAANLACIQ